MNDALQLEDPAAEDLMGQIVDEFLERQARGERPEWPEYVRRYPQLALVLRQMLPALGLLHGSAADGMIEGSASTTELTPEGPLGDYRLVREVGRGGMGVVYEAVQISLGRRVALKVLPFASALDSKQLQRFKNEAHAAAQLHHQNIVPVYGVGCERGVHFYAMQFIDGQTLAAVIGDLRRLARPNPLPEGERSQEADQSPAVPPVGNLPSGKWIQSGPPTALYMSPIERVASDTARQPEAAISTEDSTKNPAFFQSVARLGIQAAQALEHSHSLGVVHRDIKPTNLLVDARRNLWITDFGLAHVQNDNKLTLTGDILGTLRYMSPEQALAQRVVVDHRTDLYSLGATLYELLTLEPAVGGRDRHEVLRQIAFEEPIGLRRINKSIPAELETIVLKAMEKNPADRYATAQELADDLERFLKDEPIRAKRLSLLGRARKWSRRHKPVVASAGVATGVVVAIAIVALLISLDNISAALEEKGTALTEKSAALEREKETTYLQRTALAGRELAVGNAGRAEELLDECEEHLRGWEWHFLKRQRYDGEPPPLQHTSTVSRVALSPDGRQLASVCYDGTFQIWDAQRREKLYTLEQQLVLDRAVVVRGMTYSPDSRYLALARHDGVVAVWDAGRGRSLYTLEGHKGPAWQVAFSPDSRTLASGGEDRSVRLWDMASGTEIGTFPEHPSAVKGVAFRPDGRSVVAACDDGTVKVWDPDTGRETFSFKGELLAYPYAAWFSPDARRLAWSCFDGVIKIWDTTTGTLQIDQQSNLWQCRAVAFHPDGKRIVLAGFDGTLRLLDASTGREMLTIFAHASVVAYAVFSHDGNKIASCSYDHTVRIWDASPLAGDPLDAHCVTLTGHKQLVSGVAFSPDDRWLASSSWDGTVKIWETSRADLQSVREISDGLQIRPTTLTLRYTLRGHDGNVSCVAISADNRTLASGGWDKTVKLWDLQAPAGNSLSELRTIRCAGRVTGIAFSPDGQLLAIGQTNGIGLYDPASGKDAAAFLPTPAPVPALCFSPDGRHLGSAGASDPAIKFWDLGSAGASDPTIKFWDVAGAKMNFEIRHYSNPNASVAISPDGQLIAAPGRLQAAAGPTLKIWEVLDWDAKTSKAPYKERHTLSGHAGYVWKVTFSPDGRYLASGSWDSTIKVWDLKALAKDPKAEPATLRGHAGSVYGLAFSPDGQRLASGSGYADHGEVKVWDATLWQDKTSGGHEGVVSSD